MPLKSIVRPCGVCAKPVLVYPSKPRRQFCSRACMGIGTQTKMERNCERCGSAFIARKWDVDQGKGRYCSKPCAAQVKADQKRLRPIPCLSCKEDFQPRSSTIRLCSKKCRGQLAARPVMDRLWYQVDKTGTCWLGIGRNGRHWKVRIKRNDPKVFAHRLAWEEASGETIPENMVIAHVCDVGACVKNDDQGTYTVRGISYPRWGHLFLCPPAVNHYDKTEKGRATRGEAVVVGKLTTEGVIEIRRLRSVGIKKTEIAKQFGVSPCTIAAIEFRRTWRHVP